MSDRLLTQANPNSRLTPQPICVDSLMTAGPAARYLDLKVLATAASLCGLVFVQGLTLVDVSPQRKRWLWDKGLFEQCLGSISSRAGGGV